MEVSMATSSYPTSSNLDHSVSDVFLTNEDCIGRGWNLINSTDDEINKFVTPLITRVRVLYLQPLVALVGILGNLAFMFIVWKVPHMRNSMNIILLNLSVADLLYLVVGTTERFFNVLLSPVLGYTIFFGHILQCLIIFPLVNFVTFTSLLLVSLISVDRYIAICKPLQHIKMAGRRQAHAYVRLVWVFSLLLALILLPSTMELLTICFQWPNTEKYENFPAKVELCNSRNDIWFSVDQCVQILPFFIALILNLFCFVKIIFRLNMRMTSESTNEKSQHDRQVRRIQRDSANAATRMLLINGIAFFVLATPFHVTSAIQVIQRWLIAWSCQCETFKNLSILLLYINSAVNPFIYGVTNRAYRQAYYSVFYNTISKSSDSRISITTSTRSQNESMNTHI
ncbi:Mu-type opioid receptor [Holothuria leucospilota]|uniref:Mu-type opioid receptor n=1 Tax=Holothuria leucospilota TaxID=206669 RepID=A0A9Q1C338_HOLLE|nr:Mu-type opioid receptor [Holothuria leucospilota]